MSADLLTRLNRRHPLIVGAGHTVELKRKLIVGQPIEPGGDVVNRLSGTGRELWPPGWWRSADNPHTPSRASISKYSALP